MVAGAGEDGRDNATSGGTGGVGGATTGSMMVNVVPRPTSVSTRTRPEVFAGYGRDFPATEELAPLSNSLAVIATRK